MTITMTAVAATAPASRIALPARSPMPGRRVAQGDPRWPAIRSALAALREKRRHAVRIVDADCACGTVLIEAARQARMLGFTAIEAHGIDGAPALIGRARAAAARLHDPAIGLSFEVADLITALAGEAAFPADIVLWHGAGTGDDRSEMRACLAAAGDLVIGDPVSTARPARAA